jgi:hypothetical protein
MPRGHPDNPDFCRFEHTEPAVEFFNVGRLVALTSALSLEIDRNALKCGASIMGPSKVDRGSSRM